ncbi:MAG: dihydrolipoamide dehydrogenase [Alphaproteobacteria bacterium]|nr:dihydrolipoamide dehydrogenase [Alphaproteobacteria bacterium]
MTEVLKPDLCIIGAGSGGLSVAAGAVQMGASVVLIEKGPMGGDCLNFGCVPSKALLAAGHAAHAYANAAPFGVSQTAPVVDFQAVHDHVHDVIAGIAPHDSVERFESLGVTVIQGAAEFTSAKEVKANEVAIRARRFVVATGSSAFVPPIEGLADTPYLTNETVFDLTQAPGHLIVIGGGPIGCELAQAHRQLGCRVTVIEAAKVLPKDDPDLADIVRQSLLEQDIAVIEGAMVTGTARAGDGVAVTFERDGQAETVNGSHLLVAVGRKAVVDGLGLEAANIKYSPRGIEVDSGLRTSNRKVYAIGDCAGGLQFTHVAGYHAGIVIRSALFRLPAKTDHSAVPWVTYTDPELAQVGLTESEALERHGDSIRVLTWPFEENDRARAERKTGGLVKAVVAKNGRILGCGIAGPQAGELIQTWVLAMSQKLKIGALASMVAPYPTLGEVSKRAAGSFYTASLFSSRTRWVVRFLSKFG